MSADVAMTKKGFGEMAVTATLAGPIFNILMGSGFSSLKTILYYDPLNNYVTLNLKDPDGTVNKLAIIPLILIVSQLIVLVLLLINGFVNQFHIKFKFAAFSLIIYVGTVTFLCYFAVSENLSVSS
mmetsp:Transcript_434/g.409  ORF Transcript_434/g.409 Transcript_434/m.409 type:complete len:126 (+) Transcript_434:1734-2111(+)